MLAHAYMMAVCGVTLAELGTVQCLLYAHMFSHTSTNSFERVHLTFSVERIGEGGVLAGIVWRWWFPSLLSSVRFGGCQLAVELRVVVVLCCYLWWCFCINCCISGGRKYLILVRPTEHRLVWFCFWLVWENLVCCFDVWIWRSTRIIFKYSVRTAQ
jgi:hypothetical protein